MIKIIEGNLLDAKVDVIAHQTNCQGAFNSGVAKAIREYDYSVYEDYANWCKCFTPDELLGTVKFFCTSEGKMFANLFGQRNYGYDGQQYTSKEALQKCFDCLHEFVTMYCDETSPTIAMPYGIASVRGGMKWKETLHMIETTFSDMNVELWKLN